MKSIYFVILFYLVVFLSCSERTKKLEENPANLAQSKNIKRCWSNTDKQNIIKAIFYTEDLQTYTDLFAKNNLPIQVIKNEFITEELDISIKNQTMELIDSTANIDMAFELRFNEMDCEKLKLRFAIWLEYEHASIKGHVFNKNENWIAEVTSHGIVD